MSIIVALLIVVDSEALAVVVTLVLLLFLPFVSPSIDDVTCVLTVVDGATSVPISLLASLTPIPTTQLPTGDSPTGRKGLVAFLMVLNSFCRYHCFDPSDDRCGSVILGQHGLDRIIERLGDEDILLRGGEVVLVIHLRLQDFFLDVPTSTSKVSTCLFLQA